MGLLVWHVCPAAALEGPDTCLHLTLAASLARKILEGKPPHVLGKENDFAAAIKRFQLFQKPTMFPTENGTDSPADYFYWKSVPDHHISTGYKTYKFLLK